HYSLHAAPPTRNCETWNDNKSYTQKILERKRELNSDCCCDLESRRLLYL
ncbi:hypothetical protein KSS87_007467, partial [Heliosperma pusillum]